jgi:hypothetical protein
VVTATVTTDFVTAECPAGKIPVGGGGGVPYGAKLYQSMPTATGWFVRGDPTADMVEDWKVTAYAICVTAH